MQIHRSVQMAATKPETAPTVNKVMSVYKRTDAHRP